MKNFSRSSPHNTSLGERTPKSREAHTPPSAQYASVADIHGRATMVWHGVERGPQTMPAGPECRDVGIERAELIRRGHNYQHRRNYEGLYWCAGTESHIWYESMTEYTSLMYLDHTTTLTAVAAQPLCLIFEDGTKHYPDFFAVLQSGRKILIDVKPHEHMNEAVQDQFAKTAAACQTARLRSPDTDAQRCVAYTAGT